MWLSKPTQSVYRVAPRIPSLPSPPPRGGRARPPPLRWTLAGPSRALRGPDLLSILELLDAGADDRVAALDAGQHLDAVAWRRRPWPPRLPGRRGPAPPRSAAGARRPL